MSDGSFPSSPPPPPPVSPIITSGRRWWQNWWLITAAAVILIVGAAALIASVGGGSDDRAAPADTRTDEPDTDDLVPGDDPTPSDPPGADPTASDPPATDVGNAPITPPPTLAADDDPASTDAPPDDTASTDPAPTATDQVAGAPVGAVGDRLSPVAGGQIADIGEGWRLQVLGIVEDGTDLVLAENQFNDPPPTGTRFTLVDIALGYYGLDDPANAFVPTISGVGSASVGLDEDCGVIPDDFEAFVDVFSGGVLRGQLCFVTTPSDEGTIQIYAKTGFDGADVFLDASATTSPPTVMPTLPGPQAGAAATPLRLDPVPIGTPVDVGEGWTLTVNGPATDITDVVATENQFNDPPPEGFRFVGIDVEYRYDGATVVSPFEVNTDVVGDSNVQLTNDCGVIPNPVDAFGEIFSGGTVTGTLCFVTPTSDLGTLVFYGSTGFDGEVSTFATEASTGSTG